MSQTYVLMAIMLMFLITFATRALPFYFIEVFKDSPLISYLSRTLSPAIMLILVIFSLKDTQYLHYPYGLPETIASLGVALLHIWRRNVILSIGVGIVAYQCCLLYFK